MPPDLQHREGTSWVAVGDLERRVGAQNERDVPLAAASKPIPSVIPSAHAHRYQPTHLCCSTVCAIMLGRCWCLGSANSTTRVELRWVVLGPKVTPEVRAGAAAVVEVVLLHGCCMPAPEPGLPEPEISSRCCFSAAFSFLSCIVTRSSSSVDIAFMSGSGSLAACNLPAPALASLAVAAAGAAGRVAVAVSGDRRCAEGILCTSPPALLELLLLALVAMSVLMRGLPALPAASSRFLTLGTRRPMGLVLACMCWCLCWGVNGCQRLSGHVRWTSCSTHYSRQHNKQLGVSFTPTTHVAG